MKEKRYTLSLQITALQLTVFTIKKKFLYIKKNQRARK